MPLFKIEGKKVQRILPDEKKIKEDGIHSLIEQNLSTFFEDLSFVARKPRVAGKEFDTLALNNATNAPVILEYKRAKDRGVIEQVDLYYVKLKNTRDVILLFSGRQQKIEDLSAIDFDNPQIVVVAKEFTREQREILSLKSGYLRLFRYQMYDKGVLTMEEVEPLGSSGVEKISRNSFRSPDGGYPIEHFGMKPAILALYTKLDKAITELDLKVKPGKINKFFVGYGATGNYFAKVHPRVNSIMISVKLSRQPPSNKIVAFKRHDPKLKRTMTHYFVMKQEKELPAVLRAVKAALAESM